MAQAKRNWDVLSEPDRQSIISEIIDFFSTERDEEIGVIAAESILDMFLQHSGVKIYNQAIDDAKRFLQTRSEETVIDLEVNLKKSDR